MGESSGDTHNELGDVFGSAVQAKNIGQVTINMSGPTIPSRVPREVPAVIGRFINRDLGFARVTVLLPADARTVDIGLINGAPGVGKS